MSLNHKLLQELPGSRASRYWSLVRRRCEFSEWNRAAVPPDYHSGLEGHCYPVR